MSTVPNSRSSILIVDDDVLLRGMCAATLRHAGFDVCEAGSGAEALALLTDVRVDLVLLDVQMAGMDGFETCRRLRATPVGRDVPVIMLTGLDDAPSIGRAYDAGATDFMAKPFQWVLLTQRVRYSLRAAALADTRRQALDSLARAQQLAQLGSWSLNFDGAMACSDELARIVGAAAGEVYRPTPAQFLERVVEGDRERVAAARTALARQGAAYELMYVVQRFDGVLRSVHEQALMVSDARGAPLRMEGVTQDVTDRVEAERRIQHLSLYDALTGLPNQTNFQNLVAAGLESRRSVRCQCAVLEFDVDRFKSVNDALGVAVGDLVLRTLADRVKAVSRTGMSTGGAPRGAVVARVGPNAMSLFLADVAGPDEIVAVARRVLAAIAEPIVAGTHEIRLTASMGISLYPHDTVDSPVLLRYAEQALYAAKRNSGGGFQFFDASINADARSMLTRESELRRALAADELRAFLQPKIDARSGAIVGAEALVRWEHPVRGILAPAEFLPIAETTGLIAQITEWMLEQACRLCAGWKRAGLIPVPVSVNVPPAWFMSEQIVQQLDQLMQRYELLPELLVLEITESVLMRDEARCLARMHSLRKRGFGLSLDDFGTGFSALRYLQVLPLNELKLDRSFVTDVDKGGKERALATSIVTLGNMLEIAVVAEGVETQAQARELVAMGCHVHQGYLYDRPMSAASFSSRLEQGRAVAIRSA